MLVLANFPLAIWDGMSPSRTRRDQDINPDHKDYDQLLAEVIALQNQLQSLKDGATGNISMATSPAKGTDPALVKIADYLKITTKDIVLAVGVGAVASVAVAFSIPTNSLVLGAVLNIESAITLAGGAINVSLGVAGTLNKYGTVVGGAKNTQSTLAITPTALAAPDALLIYAADVTAAAAAGTIAGGSVRIRITYMTQLAVPNS